MTNIDLPTAEDLALRIASKLSLTSSRAVDAGPLLEAADSGTVVPVSGGGAEGWIYLQKVDGYIDARDASDQVQSAVAGSDLTEGASETPTPEHLAALRSNRDVYLFDLADEDGKVAARVAIFITVSSTDLVDLSRFGRVAGVPLTLAVELGRAKLTIGEVLDIRPGQVIVLDSASGDPASLYANGKLIARGDITVVDQQFAIHITEIIDTGISR